MISRSLSTSTAVRPQNAQAQPRIVFEENFKTFRLYAGQSLYAFCISPELTLEHVYWGETLPSGYDLRYLMQSSRMTVFNTTELYEVSTPSSFGTRLQSIETAETIEQLMEFWKQSRVHVSATTKTETKTTITEEINQKRLENLSWRIMGREAQSPCLPKKSKSSPGQDSTKQPFSPQFRRRSWSSEQHPSPSKREVHYEEDLETNIKSSYDAVTEDAMPSTPHASRTSQVHAYDRQGGAIGKGNLCLEYSDHGTGDFRSPSFSVVDNSNGSSISPLRYRRHQIYRGKLPMPDGLPGIRSSGDNDASTLVVTMADIGSGLEVDLIYTVMHEYDVITRRVVFRNVDTRRQKPLGAGKVIQRACSMTLDFESTTLPFYLVQLSGCWAKERYVIETKLSYGLQSIGSTRGVSSHHHNPFAVITAGAPSDTHGEAYGFSLVYSGNFLFEAEMNEMNRVRVNMGIHPMCMQWHLQQGAVFNTPEAILVRSSEGLGGISRTLHRLFIDKLLPTTVADEGPPPVLLNTWEARYFNVDHAGIVEMAKQAVSIGIDMIVLDDGWFGTRNDDTSSLGDWRPNLSKFPHGIRGLAEDVNAAGCKFGLWFEPEMVSEDSQLHRMHPDWYLRVPGRPRQVGRNQFVLDLSRREVCEYLFGALSAILSTANVEYVKWDMNRPLTEVFTLREEESTASASDAETEEGGAGTVSSVWQSETSHRYVLGLYQLLDRVVKAFPHVLLETCSSGGGRFDPGMLYYGSQIWCSDNTDAVVRMKIQYGTSLAYPARCIGAHVSSAPNHITGNYSRLRTRGFVAMCGTFGFELDLTKESVADLLLFKEQIVCYRRIAHIVRYGELYRLWDPFKVNLASWMYVTRDKSEAVVFVFSMNSDHWSSVVPRLFLQGLDPEKEYEITEPIPNNMSQAKGNLRITEDADPKYQLGYSTVYLTGKTLMHAGLPLRFYTLDDSVMFKLKRVDTPNIAFESQVSTYIQTYTPGILLSPSSSPTAAATASFGEPTAAAGTFPELPPVSLPGALTLSMESARDRFYDESLSLVLPASAYTQQNSI